MVRHREVIELEHQVAGDDVAKFLHDSQLVSDDESDAETGSFRVLRPRWRSEKVLPIIIQVVQCAKITYLILVEQHP